MRAGQLVNQSHGPGLGSPHHAGGQHELQCLESADLPDAAHATAKCRVNSKLNLRKAQPGRAVIFRDAVVKTQGEFETATQAIAVDGHDRWKGQGFYPPEKLVCFAHELSRFLDGAGLVEFPDISSDDERILFSRLHHQAFGRL